MSSPATTTAASARAQTPSDWRSVELGTICQLINGRGFKPHEWSTTGLPIIRIQNLNGSEAFNYFEGEFDPKILVKNGDLLFAWSGSRGSSFGPHIWRGDDAVLNYHTWKVEVEAGTDKLFLHQVLRHVTDLVERDTHGQASLVHTQKGTMEKFSILLPPIEEQRKIAAILSAWDSAIDVAKSLVVAKRRLFEMLREVLFQPDGSEDLFTFGDVLSESRIPGSDGAKAQKLTVKLYGKGVVAKEARIVGSENTRYFTRRSGQFIYSKLDFLNGAFGLVPPELDGFESTLDLPAFDIDLNVNPTWLVHYLSRPSFYEAQVELGKGQRIARRVNPSDFVALPLPLPPRSRQDAVVTFLDQALRSELLCEQQLDALRTQKRGLMQKLLTGEWRLPTRASEAAA